MGREVGVDLGGVEGKSDLIKYIKNSQRAHNEWKNWFDAQPVWLYDNGSQ